MYLSPYEFIRYWGVQAIEPSKRPRKSSADVKLFVGTHVPKELMQSWLMIRRPRPITPVFHGCPLPKGGRGGEVRAARIMLAYFRPWTIVEDWSCEHVPHVSRFGEDGMWLSACCKWFQGAILTEEMRRVITNFPSTMRARPQEREVEANNSDEPISDEELFLGDEDLEEALVTRPGGKADGAADDHHANAVTAISRAQSVWGLERQGYHRRGRRRQRWRRFCCLP